MNLDQESEDNVNEENLLHVARPGFDDLTALRFWGYFQVFGANHVERYTSKSRTVREWEFVLEVRSGLGECSGSIDKAGG
jgi:hypothetical protein